MKNILFFLIIVALLSNCGSKKPETEAVDVVEESEQESIDPAAEAVEETPIETFYELIRMQQFDEAKLLIEENKVDLNDFFSTEKAIRWANGKRILYTFASECNIEAIEFLLSQDVNPNIPSIGIQIDEWSSETISENFDIRDRGLTERFRNQGLFEDFALGYALSCDSSSLFYLLLNSGASQTKLKFKGAIKWSDKQLINTLIEEGVLVDFVPSTADSTILKLLLPVTKGNQYSEIGYGEGGDVFESDLMNAVSNRNLNLVSFMLRAGADPNVCLPQIEKNSDENGLFPAKTALSIGRENFDKTDHQEDLRIVDLLLKYGVEEIEKYSH